jgi:hypothetical protein
MKANGRRRWRKWARGRRKHGYGDQRLAYSREISLTDRRHRNTLAAVPLPAKPWSARSLVGMSMAARKRAWVGGALARIVFLDGVRSDQEEIVSAYSWSEIRGARPFLGQRLRPCPWCCDWRHIFLSCAEVIARQETHYRLDHCDGSGVLASRATGGRGR